MKLIIKDKRYHKEDPYVKRSIDRAVKKLLDRYQQYQLQNKTIDTVFNDDILIHDRLSGLFVYKCSINGMQFRLLYTIRNNKLLLISYYIKKKHSKEWIPFFEKVSKEYTEDLCEEEVCING